MSPDYQGSVKYNNTPFSVVSDDLKPWRKHLCPVLGKRLVELTGDYTPDLRALLNADIIVATPEKWQVFASGNKPKRQNPKPFKNENKKQKTKK